VTVYIDNFGRNTEEQISATGLPTIVSNTTYDNAGRVTSTSQPHYLNQSYYSTTNHYDSLRGYLNRQDNPDGTYKTILLTGFTEVITDERGHSRRIIKDSLGRVKEIVEPTNGVTEYGYDIFNNLIYVKDPVGNKTFIYYNDLGQKSSMDDPYMGHWEYRYDPNGNLIWQKDSENRVTIISYDDINRVYQKNYQADNRIVTHTYDQIRAGYFNKGALTTLSSPEAVYEFNYDNMGREVKETRTIDGTSYQTERQYDIAGRLEHIIYPDTARTRYNYQYNGMGYLREVRKQGAAYPYINIQDTDYNALGQIKSTHYGNGVNTAYAYYEDGSYRLKDITTTRNGTPIKYIHYEFDEAGNIEAMDVTTHTSATYTVNHDFTYDSLNRLKTATAICSNDQSRAYNQGYTYDLAGNMTNKTGIGGWDVLTWESAVNKPRMRPKSVRYDADVAGIANRNIINNQDQKPVQITYQGSTTNLYYDGTGERIKKVKGTETVIYVGGIYEVRNGQAMSYIYANGQKIVTLTNNKEYYTHSDHLGSTGIVTDETGTVVEEIGYLPFGSTLFRNTYNGSTWASAYRFTGQEFDPEYDLYNYNARLYDPIMSRFITPDTIVPNPYNPQSLNRYTYCLNNPLTYIDPSGHTYADADAWAAYMAILAQAYSLYQVWPQMGGIMLHDFLMGFDSFQTGFEGNLTGWDQWNLGFEEYNAHQVWKDTKALIDEHQDSNEEYSVMDDFKSSSNERWDQKGVITKLGESKTGQNIIMLLGYMGFKIVPEEFEDRAKYGRYSLKDRTINIRHNISNGEAAVRVAHEFAHLIDPTPLSNWVDREMFAVDMQIKINKELYRYIIKIQRVIVPRIT
jgi:RHS repeat-associated protein